MPLHALFPQVDHESHLIVDGQSVQFSKDSKAIVAKSLSPEALSKAASCPALFKVFRRRKNLNELEEIKPLPALVRLFSADKMAQLEFDARDVPMVVPPLPWTSSREGGYLLRDSKLLRQIGDGRLGPSWARAGEEEEVQSEVRLRPLFDSLNQLGSTPWRINGPLLDAVVEAFVEQEKHEGLLGKLSIPRTTLYRRYDRYIALGKASLEDRSSRPGRIWNRIPDPVR